MNTLINELSKDFDVYGTLKVWQLIIAGLIPLTIIFTVLGISIKNKRNQTI